MKQLRIKLRKNFRKLLQYKQQLISNKKKEFLKTQKNEDNEDITEYLKKLDKRSSFDG